MSAECLPPPLLALFRPRPPLEYKRPVERPRAPKRLGLAAFTHVFEDAEHYAAFGAPLPAAPQAKKLEAVEKRRAHCDAEMRPKLEEWDPFHDENVKTNPYKTLFVGRLSYRVNEDDLRHEFAMYGAIRRTVIVRDRDRRSRGYGFVEFEHARDMHDAYRRADARRIDNRAIVVDKERCRVDRDWRPRRLGGGRGFTRKGDKNANQKYRGREVAGRENRSDSPPRFPVRRGPPPPMMPRRDDFSRGPPPPRGDDFGRGPPPPRGDFGPPRRDDFGPPRRDDFGPPRGPSMRDYPPRGDDMNRGPPRDSYHAGAKRSDDGFSSYHDDKRQR